MEFRISSDILVVQYANKFTKLLRFVLNIVVSKRMMMMRRFKECLAFYIQNKLAVSQFRPTKRCMNELPRWSNKE